MIIDFILKLLFVFKDDFQGSLLIISIMALFIYQIVNTKRAKKAAEKSQESSDFILKNQRTTVPSISRHMSKIVKESATINRELDKIVYKLGADRGWVYLFHNSGYNFLGQPFAKVSNTNESLSPDVESLINIMKDIPIGILACYIEELINNAEIRCPDIEIYKEHDRTSYERFKSLKVKSFYAVTMFSCPPDCYFDPDKSKYLKEDIPLGFIGLDFVKEKKELNEEEIKLLNDSAMTIKGLLIEQRREEFQNENFNFWTK